MIDGHSTAAAVTSRGPRDSEEEFLAAAVQAALTNPNRGLQEKATTRESEATALELRVREMARLLLRDRVAYEIERRKFVLVVRGKDQALERLVAPARRDESVDHRGELFAELLRMQGQVAENQDRLVALWTEYQTLRLALFRALGTLPCDDWKSFYEQLRAGPGGGHR